MNLHSPLLFALRLTAAAFTMSAAQAAPVPAPAAGDIFLGVRASSGDGGSESYLVKLGPDTLFRNAGAGTSFDVTGLGNVGADLTATYGADWYDRSDLNWGIFGARNTATTTVYGSRARLTPAQVTAPWPALNSTDRNPVATAISSVVENVGGYKGREATANSAVATFQPNSSDNSSYAKQVGTPGTTDFGTTSQWSSIEGSFASGPAASVLDLYRLSSTSGVPNVTLIGNFTLSSNGTVRFAAPPAAGPVDTDGDGFTDTQEIYAGTNPTDAKSFFSVAAISINPAPQGIRVQSPTAANRTYIVQYSAGLNAAWTDIFTHPAGAGGTALDFTDTNAARLALGHGFYRVKIQ